MSKALRNILIVLAVIVGAAALVLVGMNFGRIWWSPMGYGPGTMMAVPEYGDDAYLPYGMGPGMMASCMPGQGMMGGIGFNALLGVEPLTVSEAEDVLEKYLSGLGNADLTLGEVMVFDNHAYAQLIEQSTGIGAMEVLVDPVTGAVSPEFGPNMMWNLKYSPMAGAGMMGMMGGSNMEDPPTEMPVTADEALRIAQRYLDAYVAGAEADEAYPFYGYYTLHINKSGPTVGMLSVNGFTGGVFLHTWHGRLIDMSETH
ncbi:MAG: hypothetical protein GTO14_12810 [Anaerolineales bacterium]|nr:hypothetical protein [Anaerolineales bacterium]